MRPRYFNVSAEQYHAQMREVQRVTAEGLIVMCLCATIARWFHGQEWYFDT